MGVRAQEPCLIFLGSSKKWLVQKPEPFHRCGAPLIFLLGAGWRGGSLGPLEIRSSSDPWGLETGLSLRAQRGCGDRHLHFARARSEPTERLGHLLCIIGRLIKEDPDVRVHQHADGQAQEVLCGEGQDRVGRKSTERSRQSCHHASPIYPSLLTLSQLVIKMGY